ncbi:alpha/beta hydrolase [Waterburya agarophytonicola K14]|uniref:Alpha/beta hydrolase n=1 Tax=Waterburya agarophytonicola KI4 TaxID=2874699 RepID=A0A964BN92_9CYAN|nr:alpha/beta hydrolase [Waterburya agarophytonicola]MCC0176554.1 alpha/beta hydrolase [Waterburya agarophytonicola KI4]
MNKNSSDESDLLAGKSVPLRRRVNLQVSYHAGETPGLVFLHGGLGNRFNWRSQYEFFLRQGREVLAYDLGGHGQSSPYQRYSLGRHRRDLRRLLRRYKVKHPILCCHSYGVPLGLEWARRNDSRGLILIAGGTHNLDPWWEIPLIKFLAWGGRHLYRFPGLQFVTNRLSSNHQHPKIERFFAESPIPTKTHPYEALEIFWGYNFWQRHQSFKKKIPVLVISGGNDPSFTQQMGKELAHSFPLGKHLHLPTAGHLLIAEYDDEVNRAIADFSVLVSDSNPTT